jgi:hypothetical protein
MGRAILVGRGSEPAARRNRDGRSQEELTDRRWTVFRVVFPVECAVLKREWPSGLSGGSKGKHCDRDSDHDLTKKYGEMFAIRSIELKLDEGDLFGFIGPNGAGKTTTMRIIATLLNPTWGEAYVCGNSIYTKAKEIRRLVGYMPDFFGVYDDMRVIEYLEFFAAAYRIRGPQRRKVCDEMLQIVDLDFKRDAYANTLSRGQTQRLGPGPHAAARPAGAAAGRTAQRPRPARPHRDAEPAAALGRWARRSSSPATSCPNWPTSATRSASSTAA